MLEKLFFYASAPQLLIEVLRKRHGTWTKHLVRLVDAEGNPVELPPGCRFEHVTSGENADLLAIHLRQHARQEAKIAG